ncbi:MAG: hypothetical protein JJT89_01760 [Nitriliruptoraceae bacterium]|nr:hypothetical protein [Nitriliruptoraceae bacterium]
MMPTTPHRLRLKSRTGRLALGSLRTSELAAAIIADIDESLWSPALNTDGELRDGAEVAEVPELVPWAPGGTRAIVRRERPHPGASLRLWDYNGLRHQVTLTNDRDGDPVELERHHRAHAQVENRIKNLKDRACPGCRSPTTTPTAPGSSWFCSPLCCSPQSRP